MNELTFLPKDRNEALSEIAQALYPLLQELEALLGRSHYTSERLAKVLDEIERS